MQRVITFLVLHITLSVNGQDRWEWSNPPTTSNNLNAVNVFDTLNIIVFGDAGTILCTTDFGQSWHIDYDTGIQTDIHDCHFFDDENGIITGANGSIHVTDDRGFSWESISVNFSRHFYSVYFTSEYDGWIVGGSGAVLRTFDSGTSWKAIDIDIIDKLNEIYFLDSNG